MTSPSPKTLIEIVIQAQEQGWNGRSLDGLDDVLSDKYVRNGALRHMTRAGLKTMIAEVRAAFPDHRSVIEDIFAAGEKVACRWTSSGTHSGEFMGVPATGRVVSTNGITISRIVHGQIAEQWTAWETPDLLRGLGVSRIVSDDEIVTRTTAPGKGKKHEVLYIS
jgi:steroid delta-isomerase-like uncharacterized protein